ncbi:hypothetical protein [Nocardiopsis metallicus]|uniref:Uncharacterized protein n=1 Tax=Nocardiopsis metallicus TaxID=179819 RepID=A0A840W5K7_9ACTN|nr:hypothetical protein [Nocardiopsis metallicus]MBB5491352.1 hypothetical protein [Nocardiopsis metallicus]
MSNKTERTDLTNLALKEWGTVVEILAERGEVWPNTDCTRWGPGLTRAMDRSQTLTEACAIIGADDARDLGRLSDLYDRIHGRL